MPSIPASVIAAVCALLGAIGGAFLKGYYDSYSQISVEETRVGGAIDLEREKFQTELILKAIDTENQQAAVKTLKFFANAGLVPTYKDEILKLTDTDQGSAIPTLRGRIKLDSESSELSSLFENYINYLGLVGFDTPLNEVSLSVDPNMDPNNGYYIPYENSIKMGINIANDRMAALYLYTSHVLRDVRGDFNNSSRSYSALETALADYFSSSFLNDPKASGGRNLDNSLTFDDYGQRLKIKNAQWFAAAEVLGGLFWQVRSVLSGEISDRAILNSWKRFEHQREESDIAVEFAATLYDTARRLTNQPAALKAIWDQRGFPTSGP